MIRLILASGSPRRRELLRGLGLPFRVLKPEISEARRPGEKPAVYVRRLAREKTAWAEARAGQGWDVLAADTAVVLGSRILGKPRDQGEQRRFLRLLSGKNHWVLTGVALRRGRLQKSGVVRSRVRFRVLDEKALGGYLSSGEGRDAAGGYAIQGRLGALLVAEVKGSYSNVVGLPMELTIRLLAAGIPKGRA